jgi:hypothetical protein
MLPFMTDHDGDTPEDIMDDRTSNVKEAIVELLDNLGTIGLFMLAEARSFLRKSWGASREEFVAAVDKAARTMKQSGKIAAEDVERTADKIKQSWELLNSEKDMDWDNFQKELTSRLRTMGDVTRETFDLCVNQARDVLDKQFKTAARLGDEQFQALRKQTEQMAEAVKSQWQTFSDHMEKTGKRIDRAMEAAWEEFKKKE